MISEVFYACKMFYVWRFQYVIKMQVKKSFSSFDGEGTINMCSYGQHQVKEMRTDIANDWLNQIPFLDQNLKNTEVINYNIAA